MRTNKRDPFHLSTEQLKCKMWPQSRSSQSSAIIFTPFSNFDQIRDSSPDMCCRLRNDSQGLLTPLWCDCKALFNWIFVTKRKSPKNIELNCQTDGVCHLALLFSNNGTTLFLPQAFYSRVIKQTFVTPTFAYESVSCILNVCLQSWFAFLFIWNMKLVGIPRLVFLSFGLFYCLPFSVLCMFDLIVTIGTFFSQSNMLDHWSLRDGKKEACGKLWLRRMLIHAWTPGSPEKYIVAAWEISREIDIFPKEVAQYRALSKSRYCDKNSALFWQGEKYPNFNQVWIPEEEKNTSKYITYILLLETPCSSVRPKRFLPHLIFGWTYLDFSLSDTSLRGSHGLSARRARRTKSSRPEGPQTRSWGPEGPLNF